MLRQQLPEGCRAQSHRRSVGLQQLKRGIVATRFAQGRAEAFGALHGAWVELGSHEGDSLAATSQQMSRHLCGGLTLREAHAMQFRVGATRSEEHTSELQPLMRTSYAVSGLTKNKPI